MDDNVETNNARKARNLGVLSVDRLSKLPEWKQYMIASQAFSTAKANSQAAKEKMRDALRKKAPQLRNIENLEFFVSVDNKTINVFEKLAVTRQKKETAEIELE